VKRFNDINTEPMSEDRATPEAAQTHTRQRDRSLGTDHQGSRRIRRLEIPSIGSRRCPSEAEFRLQETVEHSAGRLLAVARVLPPPKRIAGGSRARGHQPLRSTNSAAFGAKRTCAAAAAGSCLALMIRSGHRAGRNPAAQQSPVSLGARSLADRRQRADRPGRL